jgi:DNA mismatch endonuclease (patch repair protein)
MMAAVKGRNTAPELHVRSVLFARGFRFRLHRRDLPGNPDIVLPRYRTAIFVHGCFWHGHQCPKGKQRPQTRPEFWNAKLDRNIVRDQAAQASLQEAGWRVFIVWTCQIEEDCSRAIAYLTRKRAGERRLNRAGTLST